MTRPGEEQTRHQVCIVVLQNHHVVGIFTSTDACGAFATLLRGRLQHLARAETPTMLLQTLRQRYEADLAVELAKQPPHPARAIGASELAGLPAPVARFVGRSGWVGLSHASNARIVWRQMHLRSARNAAWMPVRCEQVNFFHQPARLALISGTRGLLPFEGFDRYLGGHGRMTLQLAKWLPVRHVRGLEADASGLVTVLSEALLVPVLLLEPYLQWTPVDDSSARVRVRCGETSVGGIFKFDEVADRASFETSDRWRDGDPPKRQRWSAEVSSFVEHKGLRQPNQVRASWHERTGEFHYMSGSVESVTFDVTNPHAMLRGDYLSLMPRASDAAS